MIANFFILQIFTIVMPPYLTFTTAKVKIKLPSYFFPNSHGCLFLSSSLAPIRSIQQLKVVQITPCGAEKWKQKKLMRQHEEHGSRPTNESTVKKKTSMSTSLTHPCKKKLLNTFIRNIIYIQAFVSILVYFIYLLARHHSTVTHFNYGHCYNYISFLLYIMDFFDLATSRILQIMSQTYNWLRCH